MGRGPTTGALVRYVRLSAANARALSGLGSGVAIEASHRRNQACVAAGRGDLVRTDALPGRTVIDPAPNRGHEVLVRGQVRTAVPVGPARLVHENGVLGRSRSFVPRGWMLCLDATGGWRVSPVPWARALADRELGELASLLGHLHSVQPTTFVSLSERSRSVRSWKTY